MMYHARTIETDLYATHHGAPKGQAIYGFRFYDRGRFWQTEVMGTWAEAKSIAMQIARDEGYSRVILEP